MPDTLKIYVDPDDDHYWIDHDPPIGPYESKRDAVDGREGVRRFYRDEYEPDSTDEALEQIL